MRGTPAERIAEIEHWRRQRMSSPAIARQLSMPNSTVTKVLRRLGLNSLKAIDPPVPVLRYQRARPGELLHLDTKKLGQIAGIKTATAFLQHALAWFAGHGVVVERVMTDNGNCYRSQMFRQACAGYGLRHLRTPPYTPRTNGKAERFIQTSLREWPMPGPMSAPSSETWH